MAQNLAEGRPVAHLFLPLAAWMLWVRRAARARQRLVDPLADTLHELGAAATGEARLDVPRWLADPRLYSRVLASDPRFITGLMRAYDRLAAADAAGAAAVGNCVANWS